MKENLEVKKSTNGKIFAKKIGEVALALTLSATPMALSAQNETTQENEGAVTSISVDSTTKVPEGTIDFYSSQEEVVEKQEEISEEEIKEYIKTHRDEVNQSINEVTEEKLMEELLNDKKIQKILHKMVNNKKIREAVMKGDEKYIQKRLQMELRDYDDTFYSLLSSIVVLITGTTLILIKNHRKAKEEKRKNNEIDHE